MHFKNYKFGLCWFHGTAPINTLGLNLKPNHSINMDEQNLGKICAVYCFRGVIFEVNFIS